MAEQTNQIPVETDASRHGAPGVPTAAPENRWDPFTGFRQELDRLFEDFDVRPFGWARPMRSTGLGTAPDRGQAWMPTPAMDMAETEAGYRLTAELPGLDADDVQVTVTNGTLTISGEKKEETGDKKPGYVMSERRYGAFRRSFRLSEEIDVDAISANFSKGVLTLSLPRSQKARTEQKTIKVERA